MKPDTIKYKTFKLSINVPFYHAYLTSRVYKIENRWQYIRPVFLYSLGTLFLGFLSLSKLTVSAEALHTNFSGGEDHTSLMTETHFDPMTNAIWNNLSRSTSLKIDRRGVQLLTEWQAEYMKNGSDVFSESNVYYLKNELERNGYHNIQEADVLDYFDALKILYRRQEV